MFGDLKLIRSCFFICLPTLAVMALLGYFFVFDVPEITRESRRRFLVELENFSASIPGDLSKSEFVWERGKGIVSGDAERWGTMFPPEMTWKEWNPVGKARSKEMRGWRDMPEGRLVWVRGTGADDSKVFAAYADITQRDWTVTFFVLGGAILAVLSFTTFTGVRYFLDYVKSRDDFLSATAHDLTTPLVAMRHMIGRDDAEASTLCERMIRLVANIKDFMRLGGKRPQPQKERFDVLEAFNEAYSLFREDYRDIFDGEDVLLDSGGLTSVSVFADRTLTLQILWNLLGNDLKYAAPYGNVHVSVVREGDFVHVRFTDEGPGMTPSQMRKAFDRYYRAKTVLQTGKGGFGIGLTTAKEFAEAMGGALTLRANKPQGCIFDLSLPC